jgi:hypothetical protein
MGLLIRQSGGFIFSELASHPEGFPCQSEYSTEVVQTSDSSLPIRTSGTIEPSRTKTESHCSGFMRTTTRTGFGEVQRFD